MYQALYRKWRPASFEDVYGQDHIVSILKNEVASGRISHAYLFCGTRGTGKTSCAKILAKAVNCRHPVDGNPCNECEICRGIDDGSILDVVEIDAASNNGVDNVRDIRDEVVYSPARAAKRVYIIDEVHMLSQGAFNALLKILEEPPEHVVFILATTEFYKIPATILSRCQRFDFHRITRQATLARLHKVCQAEGIRIEESALALIERVADGSMRDALSLLDQCTGSGGDITYADAAALCGVSGRGELMELLSAVCAGSFDRALTVLSRLYEAGRDMSSVCEQLVIACRDMLLLKSLPDAGDALRSTPDEITQLRELAAPLTMEKILYLLDTLAAAYNRMPAAADSRTELEVCLLTLCKPRLSDTNEALAARIAALERQVAQGIPASPAQSMPAQAAVPDPEPAEKAGPSAATPVVAQPEAERTPPTPAGEDAERLMEDARELLSPPVQSFLKTAKKSISGAELRIVPSNDIAYGMLADESAQKEIAAAFSSAAGRQLSVRVEKPQAARVGDRFAALKDKLKNSDIGRVVD